MFVDRMISPQSSSFRAAAEKMWKTGETMFPGLDFLRAHASMSGLPLTANGLDPSTPLSLPLPGRAPSSGPRLSSPQDSPPSHNRTSTPNNLNSRGSPRPGSTTSATTPTSLTSALPPHPQNMSSGLNALNLIQTPKHLTHGGLKPSSYSSPPPIPCNPEHNVCRVIDYRGQKVAAFIVESRELICLPQAFELFLKHLVGGLHTVYTKLKRLEITPVVCNVEQVRILRGLGAIQPGVNRCKLISCSEFDTLFEDCTNSNARPGRPPKRVHANPVDNDVLEKLKRRKLEIPGDYPYDQRFYERKSLMNGFPPVGYPAMPQFSNFFGMHHLMQPMAMASHIGLRPDGGLPKLERTSSDSGIVSPRLREERLPMLGMYGTPPGLDPRLPPSTSEGENKPLNLQVNGHPQLDSHHHHHHHLNNNNKDRDSDGSRTDDEGDADIDADGDDITKLSDDDDRHDDDLDDSYDSNDDYPVGDSGMDKSSRGGASVSMNPFTPPNGDASAYVDLESFVTKFNAVVRALVDAAKSMERRAGEEKNQLSVELVREKERRQELEREMQEEKKKREFFQRRVRRLKKALSMPGEPVTGSERTEVKKMTTKPELPSQTESSPESIARNAQEAGPHDSDSEKPLSTSTHSETDKKNEPSTPTSERTPTRRDSVFESFPGSNGTQSSGHHPSATSPIKYQFHSIVASSDA